MKIRRHIRNYIIERLAPHVGPGQREAFIFDALYDTTIPDRIEWSGNNRVFAARVVDMCLTYGVDEESDKHSLILIIETLKTYVGRDKKIELDDVIGVIQHRVSEGRPALEDTNPTRPPLLDAAIKDHNEQKQRQTRSSPDSTDPTPVVQLEMQPSTDPTPPEPVFNLERLPLLSGEDTVPGQPYADVLPEVTVPQPDENTRVGSVVQDKTDYDATIIKPLVASYVPPASEPETYPSRESASRDTLSEDMPVLEVISADKKPVSKKILWSVTSVSAVMTLFLIVFFSNLAAPITSDDCALISCETSTPVIISQMIATPATDIITVTSTPFIQQPDAPPSQPVTVTETATPSATATTLASGGTICTIGTDSTLTAQTIPCFFGTVGVSLNPHPTLTLLASEHARYLANLPQRSIENVSVYRFESGNPLEAELTRLAYNTETSAQMVVLTSDETLSFTDLFAEMRRKELDLMASYRVYGFAQVISLNGRRNVVLIVGTGI